MDCQKQSDKCSLCKRDGCFDRKSQYFLRWIYHKGRARFVCNECNAEVEAELDRNGGRGCFEVDSRKERIEEILRNEHVSYKKISSIMKLIEEM